MIWWNKIDKLEDYVDKQQYKKIVSDLLDEHNAESIEQLATLYEDRDFIRNYASEDAELGYIYIVICIYREEKKECEKNNILSVRRTKDELIELISQFKFLLWRIELLHEDDAVDMLMHYFDYENLSVIFLVEMIRIGSIDRASMFIKLGEAYRSQKSEIYAFELLRYANGQEPGNEKIVCMLADMCIQYGNIESAKKLLETVARPGKMTESLRRKVYANE